MTLYLQKRGCDFRPEDNANKESDLGNYRLFLEFIDKEGRRVCGDVTRGAIREYRKGKYKVISENGLFVQWQYENYKGCYGYPINAYGRYKKADVLHIVNSVSAVQYDSVEIVNELPPAAHEYPESALALERAYLAADHAALVDSVVQKIRENFTVWLNASSLTFRGFTPEEYKRVTLTAFRLMVEKYGIVEVDIHNIETRLKSAAFVAHHMTKHFFEEQDIIDPCADNDFLKELETLSPYYVGRYIPTMTPEEFIASVKE